MKIWAAQTLIQEVQLLEKSYIFLARHRKEREEADVLAAMLCPIQG